MIKGKILRVEHFDSKEGKPLTSLRVMFENDEVANVLVSGKGIGIEKGQTRDFEPVAYGRYSTAQLGLVEK